MLDQAAQVLSVLSAIVLVDGRLDATGKDSSLGGWDLATGAEAARIEGAGGSGPGGANKALCALPDGCVAAARGDASNASCNLGTGAATHVDGHRTGALFGHARIHALAAVGKDWLASASSDGSIRLWDIARRAEIARFVMWRVGCRTPGRMPSGSGIICAAESGTA